MRRPINPTAGPTKAAAARAEQAWWEREVRGPLAALDRGRRRVVRKPEADDDGWAGFDAAVRLIEDTGTD